MYKEKPLFSIVVPIYNEERFIREALDSIAAQTDPDWEALLINDGSTDSTPSILDEYAERDNRFRVFHKKNGGQSTAINKGVQEARGKWLCWLSGDDYFHPQKLEMHRKWMREYPGKEFFFTGFWLIESNGKKIEYGLEWLNLENATYHFIQLFRANYVMGISICITREAWLRNGEFDEKLRFAHDLDMWLRLMLNTPTQYVPARTCTMRTHPGQESARFPIAGLLDSSKAAIHILNNHPFEDLFPDTDLKIHQTALDVLSRTLDFVACEPTSNYYTLGFHPLLHMRILEWLWKPSMNPLQANELQSLFRKRASSMATQHTSSSFGFLWKVISAATSLPEPTFKYFPTAPDRVGELHYYIQQAAQTDVAQPLRTYLERFDGLRFEDDPADRYANYQLILVLPPDITLDNGPDHPNIKVYKEIWRYLVRVGFSIVLVGTSQYTLGLMDGLPYLGAETTSARQQLIRALGSLDIMVTFVPSYEIKPAMAERIISMETPRSDESGNQIATEILKTILHTSKKKYHKQDVVFIARTLWGGGTEKVLYELAHSLDRNIFTPTVLYFLEEENPIAYDLSIQTICLESLKDSNFKLSPIPQPATLDSRKQKAPNFLQVAYYALPSVIREKMNLPQRLRFIQSRKIQLAGIRSRIKTIIQSMPQTLKRKVLSLLRVIYHIIPSALREKINISQRLYVVKTRKNKPSNIETYHTTTPSISDSTIETNHPSLPVYEMFDAATELWPYVTALRKALNKFPQDAILVPLEEWNTVILWLSQLPPLRKVLASQHAPYSDAQRIRYPEEQMRRVKEWLYINACRAADIVTFPSEKARLDLISNFRISPKHTLHMPNLIDCNSIIQKARQPLPNNLAIPKRKTIFTQVARLSYEKNPLLLVEACDLLRKQYDNFVVLYVGDGPMNSIMREQISQRQLQEHILLLGEQANPYPYMALARAVLLTSRLESFGLVIAEAMLCGAVPVTTDCGGPRELLDNGRFGLLLPTNNAQLFAEAMYKIALDDDLHSKLRTGAQSWVLRFDSPRAVREWEDLILRITENQIDY